jgi:general secretion pathway protein K
MPARKRQRGVAVITALLLTTLAVTIVASLFWQQQVQVRSMENQRLHLQIQWILRGTLDWTKLILLQDGRDNATFTSLQHVWAVPVANTRIDQYIDRERVQGEVFDASLSGQIIDAQSRFNLTNLATAGVRSETNVAAFKKLLTQLRLDPGLATTAAQFVAAGQTPISASPTNGTAPVAVAPVKQMRTIELEDLLDVDGFTPEAIEKLRKYVVVLPEFTKVNVNTASAEVISAMMPNMSLTEAQTLVTQRDRTPWRDMNNFQTALQGQQGQTTADLDVLSKWFLVQSWLKLDRASLNTEALIKRDVGLQAAATVIWVHQN